MKDIFKFCSQYLSYEKKMVVIYICLCISSSVLSLVLPYISGNFIDYLIEAKNTVFLFNYCVVFGMINVFCLFIGYIINRLYIKLQTKAGYLINKDIIIHIHRLPISYIQNQNIAYLNQRINNDSNSIVTFSLNLIQGITINLVKFIISIVLLVSFKNSITIGLIIIVTLYLISYGMLKKPLFNSSYKLKEVQANYFSDMYEQLAYTRDIKIHVIQDKFIKKIDKAFDKVMSIVLKNQKISYVFSGLDNIITTIAQIFLYIMGGMLVINKELSIGQFTVLSVYFNMLISSIRYFFSLGKTIEDNKVSYERIKNILGQTVELNGKDKLLFVNKIELKNIIFSHNEKTLLNGINLVFEKGKIYSVIGNNGAGKSTLLYLIMGLYSNEYKGNILYNGILSNKIDLMFMRQKLFSISEQEPRLLEDTILYNITYDQKDIDNKSLEELINVLYLNDLFKELPRGLNSIIKQNANNFSGGEKQKISLLRTLLKNTDVIILDEPTSALDFKTCSSLKQYLSYIKKDKIIILVTHSNELLDICDVKIEI